MPAFQPFVLAAPLTAVTAAHAQSTVPVTVDNFTRAESGLHVVNLLKASRGKLGVLVHRRERRRSTRCCPWTFPAPVAVTN